MFVGDVARTGFSLVGSGKTAQLALDGSLVTLGTLTLAGCSPKKSPANGGKGEFCYRCAPPGSGILRVWYQVSISHNGVHGAIWICSNCSTVFEHKSAGKELWAELTKGQQKLSEGHWDDHCAKEGDESPAMVPVSSEELDTDIKRCRGEMGISKSDIEELILHLLFRTPDLSAFEICDRLSASSNIMIDKSAVNSLLYGPLKRKVQKDLHFRWSLSDCGKRELAAKTKSKPAIFQEANVSKHIESVPNVGFEFNRLFSSDKPHYLITEDQFRQWLAHARTLGVENNTVGAIAEKLNIECESAFQSLPISTYLDFSLVDLYELEDPKFRKTLLLCIAGLANDIVGCTTLSESLDNTGIPESTGLQAEISTSNSTRTDEDLIVSRFKSGRESAVGLARMFHWTPAEIVTLLERRGYLSEIELASHNKPLPTSFSEALESAGISFEKWCLSISIKPDIAERAVDQLSTGKIISGAGLTSIQAIKSDFPDVYKLLAAPASDPPTTQTITNPLIMGNKPGSFESQAIQLFFEGKGIVTISRTLSVNPLLVFSTLVQAKFIKRKPGHSYNIAKIPPILRERLKTDSLNFGIWCDSMGIHPKEALKSINALEAGTEVPEAGHRVVEMLEEEYPDIYDMVRGPSKNEEATETDVTSTDEQTGPASRNNKTDLDYTVSAFLRKLKLALSPIDLIGEDLWTIWTNVLLDAKYTERFVATEARKLGLHWCGSREQDQFGRYLYLSLHHISQASFGLDIKRTVVLCVAYVASELLPGQRFLGQRLEDGNMDLRHNANQALDLSFEQIFTSEDPADIVTTEIWDNWKMLIGESSEKYSYISDLVDEIGSLYWQARWSKETLYDYMHYEWEDIKGIKYPGKARTVIIAFAKIASTLTRFDNICQPTVPCPDSDLPPDSYFKETKTAPHQRTLIDEILDDYF